MTSIISYYIIRITYNFVMDYLMNTENIKLVGVDLDGTLLTDDKRLFPETTEKIKELSKRGMHFVPITGRAYSGIPEDIKQIK